MLDLIGAVVMTLIYAALAGSLIGFSRAATPRKLIWLVLALGWLALMLGISAVGGFAAGTLGPIPVALIPFGLVLLVLLGAWRLARGFREAILAVPLGVLVALNIARLAGVLFVLLGLSGRLSAPFAPAAGFGDIMVALLAIPLSMALLKRRSGLEGWVAGWNLLGLADLVMAVSLALLSVPGTPFRVFTSAPGTAALTEVPWIMVASTIVPVYFFIHIVITERVRAVARNGRWAAAPANG